MPLIKFKIMQKHSLKNNDELIQGIRTILSNDRCSFSDEEQVLLNDCINKLEESRTEPDPHVQKLTFVKVLEILLRIFTFIDHVKDLF